MVIIFKRCSLFCLWELIDILKSYKTSGVVGVDQFEKNLLNVIKVVLVAKDLVLASLLNIKRVLLKCIKERRRKKKPKILSGYFSISNEICIKLNSGKNPHY